MWAKIIEVYISISVSEDNGGDGDGDFFYPGGRTPDKKTLIKV